MKKIYIPLLMVFAIAITIFSCTKENFIEVESTSEITLERSDEEVTEIMDTIWPQLEDLSGVNYDDCFKALKTISVSKNANNVDCYYTGALLDFIAVYNTTTPDIVPGLANDFFQDAFCALSNYEMTVSVRNENGTANFSELAQNTIQDFSWSFDNDAFYSTGTDTTLTFINYNEDGTENTDKGCNGDYQPPFNGYHRLVTIRLTAQNGAIYERSGDAWGLVQNVPEQFPTVGNALNNTAFDFSNGFFNGGFNPYIFDEYEFCVQSSTFDFNGNYTIDSDDLLTLLSFYGTDGNGNPC